MPVNAGHIRDFLLPGLREVVDDHVDWPVLWQRLFSELDTALSTLPAGNVVIESTDELLVANTLTPTTADANNGEDDGLVFPYEWKGV